MTELCWPYTWEERRVAIEKGVLFLPDRLEKYEDFELPKWEVLFGNSNPVAIEYCSGNGAWIGEKAALNPKMNWVAVEKKFDRVRKIWKRRGRLGLQNLFIIYGEGMLATRSYIPSDSVSEIYINFPDPWPKRRHWENRIMQDPFIEEMGRILKPQGKFLFVTDDAPYSEAVLKQMESHSQFRKLFGENGYLTEMEGYGSSYFEELWRSKGREIRYHGYQKCS